jgi:biotin carboxyl carrier protein (BCCP)
MKKYEVEVNGEIFIVSLKEISNEEAAQKLAAAPAPVPSAPVEEKKAAPTGDGEVVPAPMAGIVLSVNKNVGDAVKKGDVLVILEAMKMENEILAPCDGVVKAIHVSSNESVESNQPLLTI